MRALRWLRAEQAAGRRQRPSVCDACGQDKGIVDNHSEDYSEPFGDHIGRFSLCFTCHAHVHTRDKCPGAWGRYKRLVSEGFRFQPSYRRDWPRFASNFLRRAPKLQAALVEAVGPPPARRILDEIERESAAIRARQADKQAA